VRQRVGFATEWAVAILQQALADAGIVVRGAVQIGPPPAGPLRALAIHYSEPLADICRVVNKDSNNYVADAIWKTLGAERFGLPGTLEKGAQAVSEWLAPLGLSPSRVHLVNGSGLTYENRVRPEDLGQLLYKLYHSLDLGPVFMQTLAVGGIDGTIHYRFRGPLSGLVRGKTGTLNGVSVLSGYVGAQPGVLIFTIFVEGFRPRRLEAIRQAQATLVEEMMRCLRDGGAPLAIPALSPTKPGEPGEPGKPAAGGNDGETPYPDPEGAEPEAG
jgi:D-alanyl-D-alanine carboxypeptidase/D-alanyl-D-alanine-endopeptidase (penicillin-binding protein 4)